MNHQPKRDYPFLIEFDREVQAYKNFLMTISEQSDVKAAEDVFFKRTKEILLSADVYSAKCLNGKHVKILKEYFREALLPLAQKSVIVKRGYEKPRGYPGDYATLEMIYDNKDVSTCILGRLFDRYLLRDSYVTAVRNRKEKMKELLRDALIMHPKAQGCRILNIASGGARDIREFLIENETIVKNKKVEFVFVDQDDDALTFSKKQIDSIRSDVHIQYVNENISGFFSDPKKFKNILGEFDVIYSIGLIDYIPDALLEKLIVFCFEMLVPGGKLFLAVKNTAIFKSLASDWFCDWDFYLRDQKKLISLFNQGLGHRNFRIDPINGKDEHISFVMIESL